jgi:large subunit ribosomal protein L10
MPSDKKVQAVAELQEKVKKAKSVFFANYAGMNVKQQQELRRQIRAAGGEITIAKNRLVDIALGKPAGLGERLTSQLFAMFSYSDEVSALKVLAKFASDNEKPVIHAGFFEGKVLSDKEVIALSKTPSKDELIATVLRTIKGPIYGLRNVLDAGPRNLVYALSAIQSKKEKSN